MASTNLGTGIVAAPGCEREYGPAGEALILGKWVYRATNGKWMLGDASALASADVRGVVEGTVPINGRASVITDGVITGTTTVVVGTGYVLDEATPGNMVTEAELGTTDWVTTLCRGITASSVRLCVKPFGVQVP